MVKCTKRWRYVEQSTSTCMCVSVCMCGYICPYVRICMHKYMYVYSPTYVLHSLSPWRERGEEEAGRRERRGGKGAQGEEGG